MYTLNEILSWIAAGGATVASGFAGVIWAQHNRRIEQIEDRQEQQRKETRESFSKVFDKLNMQGESLARIEGKLEK